ncbi:hypothetical protein CEUSTIGMA_g4231.t1 [Chlamydomonas eustigma]|uniref:NodB homology domain-containing protein n=1 Tax=Chlamydomonas eustigma TaxID=1157962 RepID=A0A250X156_9CHLO|nr:hypothetical protein CEUSTIGMA_g4231.t1 [Chlamydomonas eustigma]|eukprot:GAX76785.1 hypothetical protein CEUSTIGMA_g4231.t1 [Chlamydomonas eustigma]
MHVAVSIVFSIFIAFYLVLFVSKSQNVINLSSSIIFNEFFGRKSTGALKQSVSPASVHWGCESLDRGVTLTFDDGPGPYTAQLLDLLKRLDIKATFFVMGVAAIRRPELILRMVDEGHVVASHTWGHANLTDVMMSGNLTKMDAEIIDTEDLLFKLTGRRPRLIRPPYGAANKEVVTYLGGRGYSIVMWSGGCIDWFFHDMVNKEIPVYINGMADAGALLCFHDNGQAGDLVSHLEELVTLLRTAEPRTTANPQGRKIISMPECLDQEF